MDRVRLTSPQAIVAIAILLVAGCFRLGVVHWLPNDSAGDSVGYEQIARNVLEQHVYTHIDEAPFTPTNVRLPGYPLFLAAVYSVFGHTNNTAVRIVQALLDTGTCVLVALLAWLWQPHEQKKRTTAMVAMALAAVNPFTTIYCATILTEVPSTFLFVAACVAATLAFRADKLERELRWWAISGLITGIGVLFRPDVGLVAASIGVMLLLRRMWSAPAERSGDGALDRPQVSSQKIQSGVALRLPPHSKFSGALFAGAIFSAAFILALAPWTIRNWRTLHVFQPLAPLNANMPGEFVPLGYHRWLKTWMTDGEYLDPLMWDLGKEPVDVGDLPETAFDSPAERDRIASLYAKFTGSTDEKEETDEDAQPASSPSPSLNQSAGKNQTGNANEDEDEDQPEPENAKPDQSQPTGEISPEIDAGFAQVAGERIARHPLRYYVLLPLRRAHALWFNTHSDFYPFNGNAFPLLSPENTRAENFWLPIFAVLVGIYTVLGVGGLFLLMVNGGFNERAWVLLVFLIFATRLALFSTAVSVEPRYVVEFFPILSVTAGIAIMNFKDFFKRDKSSST